MHAGVNHAVNSSASAVGGIQVEDQPKDMDRPSFIRMDPPNTPSSARWWRPSWPRRWSARRRRWLLLDDRLQATRDERTAE
jgi:hypothetical protein